MVSVAAAPVGVNDARRVLPLVLVVVALSWCALALMPMSHDQMSHGQLGFVAMWTLMVMAMMIPTALRPLVRIAGGSALRAWAFLGGYLMIWAAMAVPATVLVNVIPWSGPLITLGWIAVGLYQQTPWAQRALRRCRSLRAADPAFASGTKEGVACVTACFPLMLIGVVTLTGLHTAVSLLAMLALAVFMTWEKSPRVGAGALRASGIAIVLGASLLLALGGPATGHQHSVSHPAQPG